MKTLFRKIFFGDIVIREYSTITVKEEIKEKVYLQTKKFIADISQHQFLLCLEPVVFGIWLDKGKPFVKDNENYKMFFKVTSGKDYGKEKTLAVINLELF